jgi:phenol hydroxylase P5 protein
MSGAPPAGGSRRPALQARITSIFDHNEDTRSLFLRVDGAKMAPFTPGQFISIAIPFGGETLTRPYTIASDPGDEEIEICFNRVPGGRGVGYLFDRRIGDTLDFTGPFGLFTLDAAPPAETILVAEATAIAPIRPMVRRALATAPAYPLFLLHAAPDESHLLYRDEFASLAHANPILRFEPIVSDAPWPRLAEIVRARWIDGDAVRDRRFFLCGVGAGVIALRDLLRGAGYERRAVRYEQW